MALLLRSRLRPEICHHTNRKRPWTLVGKGSNGHWSDQSVKANTKASSNQKVTMTQTPGRIPQAWESKHKGPGTSMAKRWTYRRERERLQQQTGSTMLSMLQTSTVCQILCEHRRCCTFDATLTVCRTLVVSCVLSSFRLGSGLSWWILCVERNTHCQTASHVIFLGLVSSAELSLLFINNVYMFVIPSPALHISQRHSSYLSSISDQTADYTV